MKKKVLIIDDEQDIVTYLMMVLEENGHVAYSADNVKRGLRMLEEVKPDLVCLDIMMPKESGISMYMRMKADKRYADIPVLIISGVEQEREFDFRIHVPDRAIPPPQQYLEKPIDVERFLRLVRRLVGVASAGRKAGRVFDEK